MATEIEQPRLRLLDVSIDKSLNLILLFLSADRNLMLILTLIQFYHSFVEFNRILKSRIVIFRYLILDHRLFDCTLQDFSLFYGLRSVFSSHDGLLLS